MWEHPRQGNFPDAVPMMLQACNEDDCPVLSCLCEREHVILRPPAEGGGPPDSIRILYVFPPQQLSKIRR